VVPLGFWKLAEDDPDRVAVIDPEGHAVTAGALLAAANRTVHGLRALGLRPGDTIAAVLPNGVTALELALAAHQAGWYLTPINHHFTASEIAYIVTDSDAAAVVGHEQFGAALAAVGVTKERRFAVGQLEGYRPIEELTDGQSDATPGERATGATMHYTSGTTGRPKGVRRPLPPVEPEVVVGATKGIMALVGISPGGDHVHLNVSPMYHTVVSYTLTSLHYGHTVVLRSGFDPLDALDSIERYRVTTTHMVPTMFHRLLALPEEARGASDTSSLRYVLHAAAPCPPSVKRGMLQWWGPVLYEYYGATEGGGTIARPEEWLARPGTVGRAWDGAEVRILDDNGQPQPAGEPGTIWMALGANRFEYHNDPDKTAAHRRDGFFTVGDVGYLDGDGFLFLCDRKADMIISGGVNIYPAEIEGVLLGHPKVADAAVFGIPDEEWGERVKAVVQPASGVEAGVALQTELLEYCRRDLARYKVPRTIDFTAELPRDPSGKLYKRHLRDPYWRNLDRAI
jgi:long-chain acyl-CoA synthetase